MDDDLRARADARFARALERTGARDPRDFLRRQMRALKESDAAAYRRAAAYFEETLTPAVAEDDSDPLGEWLEFARVLAELTTPGRAVWIDATGRSSDYERPVPPDALVLHLPENPGAPAILLGLPPDLSPHQRAAYDLLVRQTQG
jgi:hypothetical protein